MSVYDGILNLQALLEAKRRRQMTHTDSYSQSNPVGISFEGVPEKFARGIYQGPGDAASVFDLVSDYTFPGMVADVVAPTNTTLESEIDALMGLKQVEDAYKALRPAGGYASDNTIQGDSAEFFAPWVSDPFLVGGTAIKGAEMGGAGALKVLNEMAHAKVAGTPWRGQGATGYRPPAQYNSPPSQDAVREALGMKAEMMFDPGGIDYDMIARQTGVQLERREVPRGDASNTIGSSQKGAITTRNGESVVGSASGGFDRTTTDMPYYDDLIKAHDSEYKTEYYRDQKGVESRLVDITPDEYLRMVDEGFTDGGVMSGIEDAKVKRYAKKLQDGETFPALTLDYARGKKLSQEGRHRALAAKMAGIDSVPVLVVTPTPEEAAYLGVNIPELRFLTRNGEPVGGDPAFTIGGKQRGSIGVKPEKKPQGLLGPVPMKDSIRSSLDDDGQLVMTHYSDQALDTVDPEKYGSNLSGKTIAEVNRSSHLDFENRSSYMLETEADRYIRERGIGNVKNKVRVPPQQMYDPREDPLGLWKLDGKAPSNTDEVTEAEKRIKDAGFTGYWVNHPTMGHVAQVFDELPVESPLSLRYSHGELSQVPDRPQVPMERYEPPRGIPKGLEDMMSPEVEQRMREYAEAGSKKGGKAWYNLQPLRDAFVHVLGKEEGIKQFDRYVDIVAATSPRSQVEKNIVRGAHLRKEELAGNRLDSHGNLDEETGKAKYGRENVLPKGTGHIAHETHQGLLEELADGGHFSSVNRPKTSSFAENLKGNQEPLTIDTHNMAALKGDPKFKKSPSKTQYKFLEDFEAGIAKDVGMTPAQFQASVWMGADTGVADARPFMDVFRDVVKNTAKKTGSTFEEVVEGFIKGEIDLMQFMVPVTTGVTGAGLLSTPAEESVGE